MIVTEQVEPEQPKARPVTSVKDYEDVTIMNLRRAQERKRLVEQLLKEEKEKSKNKEFP